MNFDLSEIKSRKPKMAVSLSLDKKNIAFLKEEMKKQDGITISGVFDLWLNEFVEQVLNASRGKQEQ